MKGGRHLATVEIEKGYLTLESEEALDFFNDQVESGLLWQVISKLFNDYVEGQQSDSMNNKVNEMIELQKMMIERLAKANIKSLPSDKIVEPKEPTVIKEVTVSEKPLAPKGSGMFSSLANKFSSFKD